MLREDLPWPPPTQLRERPNMSAAQPCRPPHGFISIPPSSQASAATSQTQPAAAGAVERPPSTFLPGPQPRTDIQPEPAVRPPCFTAAAARNSGKCSSRARLPATGLCERTTRPCITRATVEMRRGKRKEGGGALSKWAGTVCWNWDWGRECGGGERLTLLIVSSVIRKRRAPVEVRAQLSKVGSRLPPFVFWELNSGLKSCQQASFNS